MEYWRTTASLREVARRNNGEPHRFFPATDMTPDTIRSLQEKLRIRILRYLERHGRLDPIDVYECLRAFRALATRLVVYLDFVDPAVRDAAVVEYETHL
jgi:hypothetical protein